MLIPISLTESVPIHKLDNNVQCIVTRSDDGAMKAFNRMP